jgi:hypothetical protein
MQLNFAKREEFCLENGCFAAEIGKIYKIPLKLP